MSLMSIFSPRGPYAFWANGDPAKSFCNRTVDRFCDSPDTIVDIDAAVKVIVESLMASRRHCSRRKNCDRYVLALGSLFLQGTKARS